MALTTDSSRPGWSPDVVAVAPVEAIPDALILSTSVVAGRVEGDAPSVRAVFAEDNTPGFVDEGATISEDDPTLGEVVVATGKVASLTRISRELWLQANTGALLSTGVQRSLIRAANVAYLQQEAPTPGPNPPAGLLEQNPTQGGTVDSSLDAIIDAIAHVELHNGEATHILTDPVSWAELQKMKQADTSNVPLLGAGTDDTARRLLGRPVIVTPAMPQGKLLVLDKAAVVSAVGDVLVATSDQAYFASDSIGLRVTFRFGQTVVDPDRLVVLDVDVDSSSSEDSSGS